MEIYTKELSADIIFPNISVYRDYRDGIHYGYEVYANNGYVMYDTTANDYERPEPDGTPVLTTYYYTWITFPKNFNFANFTWMAVLKSTVDENYIF